MISDELTAYIEIHQCLARYCRGVDRRDAELIRSAFHPGAEDDHGAWKGTAEEFADWIVERLKDRVLVGQHHITNVYVDFRGSEARVESYYLAYHPRLDEGLGEVLLQTGGRYLDWFEQRAGAWKIARRQVLNDWTRAILPGEPWSGAGTFPKTGPKGSDPSDALFAH
jgi:SnoaL-like domain